MGWGTGSSPLAGGALLGRREGMGRAWEAWRGSGRAVSSGPSPLCSLWELPLQSVCWVSRNHISGGQAFESFS